MPEHITICEMSPRDGMQSVNRDCKIPIEMRVELIETLQRAKFPYIEAASFVSPKVFPQFQDSVDVFQRLKPYAGQLASLVPNLKYYEQFASTPNLTTVAVFLSASDEYSRKNKRITIDEDLEDARQIARVAKERGHRLRAHLSGAFRGLTEANRETDPAIVARVCRDLIHAGCELVALADTDGRATPDDLERVISHVFDSGIDRTNIGVHLHDREGHALDNARAALDLGVRTFDSAIGGIGGNRASTDYVGNIATETILKLCDQLNLTHGLELVHVREAQSLVAKMVERSNA